MSNAEIKIIVSNELALEILDSIEFPISIVTSDNSFAEDDSDSAETGTETPGVLTISRDRALTVQASLAEDSASDNAILLRELQLEVDGDDIEIVNALKEAGTNATRTYGKAGDFKKRLLGPIKRAISVELVWISLDIDKPTLRLGEQILLLQVEAIVQIQFKVCIKYFGKKISRTFMSDFMTLQASQLKLDLHARGTKISLLPSFTHLDVVLRFSLFGISFNARPGITSIINAQLRKRGPLRIMDLTSFQRSLPFSSRKLVVESVGLTPEPEGLAIKVEMKIE